MHWRQLYFPDSAVLMTRFMTDEGVGKVLTSCRSSGPETPTDRHRLVRVVRIVRETMRFLLECAPRFDYGPPDVGIRTQIKELPHV